MSLWIPGTEEGYEKGITWLHNAADLWSLVDPKRGNDIRRWIDDWWVPDENDPEIRTYAVGTLPLVAGMLVGLDDALAAEVTDRGGRLSPEAVALIPSNKQWMIDSWNEPDGTVHTLANRLWEVRLVGRLIDKAIAMGCPLEIRLWGGP